MMLQLCVAVEVRFVMATLVRLHIMKRSAWELRRALPPCVDDFAVWESVAEQLPERFFHLADFYDFYFTV